MVSEPRTNFLAKHALLVQNLPILGLDQAESLRFGTGTSHSVRFMNNSPFTAAEATRGIVRTLMRAAVENS